MNEEELLESFLYHNNNFRAVTKTLVNGTKQNTRRINLLECDVCPVSSIYIWSEIFRSPSEANYGGQWRPSVSLRGLSCLRV